jgi:hypothetical protein
MLLLISCIECKMPIARVFSRLHLRGFLVFGVTELMHYKTASMWFMKNILNIITANSTETRMLLFLISANNFY